MKRKFATPEPSELFERIMDAYKYKERGSFRALCRWYYNQLTPCMKKELDDIIDEEKLLAPIRQAYHDKDYYEMKRLIEESGWLLSEEKEKQVIKHMNDIYPSELIQHAYKIFYVPKDSTKD